MKFFTTFVTAKMVDYRAGAGQNENERASQHCILQWKFMSSEVKLVLPTYLASSAGMDWKAQSATPPTRTRRPTKESMSRSIACNTRPQVHYTTEEDTTLARSLHHCHIDTCYAIINANQSFTSDYFREPLPTPGYGGETTKNLCQAPAPQHWIPDFQEKT